MQTVLKLYAPVAAVFWVAQAPEDLSTSLQRALDHGGRELHYEVECFTHGGFHTLSVLGNGVGSWGGSTQIRLSQDAVKTSLEWFLHHDFANMPERHGGMDPKGPDRRPPKIICRVMLDIDGARKEVVQLDRGEPSKSLRELADRLFEVARPAVENGVRAADLSDGLAKIENGALTTEALFVEIQRRSPSEGWLLQVQGRKATTRLIRETSGFADPIERELDEATLVKLAGLLHDLRVSELPTNLYAEHYTDLGVRVLSHEKKIQARAFARLNPTTLGERQERFDEIFAALFELQQRVAREGETR